MSKPSPKPFTLGIAAPSGAFQREVFLEGVAVLKQLGFAVWHRDDIFSKERYLAGSDLRRRDELHELFMHPEIDAIMFARGGYGVQRILPLLSPELINKHPKPVLGYSDLTALFLWLQKNCTVPMWYGPVVTHLGKFPDLPTQESLVASFITPRAGYAIPTHQSVIIQTGNAHGHLKGGCLTMLTSCIGTTHQLQLENDLLLLEDVEEPLYKIDRALTQLQQSGVLAKASGIIFGKTVVPDCPPAEFHKFLAEFFAPYKIPVIADFPAGHTPTFISVPLGRRMELKAQLSSLQLQTLE